MGCNIVMLGPPGAGKGTQAGPLAGSRNLPRISTGDILREAVQSTTELGRIAEVTIARGELVSDEVVIGIVRERLAREDTQAGFVLDGFPRTITQAEALDVMLADRAPLIVLKITVPAEELLRRLSARCVCGQCSAIFGDGVAGSPCAQCGGPLVQRNDDRESVVRERLEVYARDTEPLTNYYRERQTFAEIDGAQPTNIVRRSVEAAVGRLQGAARRPAANVGASE